jgi:SsrA-binding protein
MRILNKKAGYNYKLFEKFEAGIVLIGAEVKAVKRGQVDLSRSYAKIVGGEVFLINANISVPGKKDYDPTKSRKLLLHKNQILTILAKSKAKRLTLIPTKVYTRGRLVKIEVALAKGKRKFEKKNLLKRRDVERELEKEIKLR